MAELGGRAVRRRGKDLLPVIDFQVPQSARVYDYLLGGKDNWASDRRLVDRIRKILVTFGAMARENRSFMERATRNLVAHHQITQFLDIGVGMPTAPNLHEVAQHANMESRVVYVDNDILVMAHVRALMQGGLPDHLGYLEGDLTKPQEILNAPELEVLDLSRPVALMMLNVLDHIADEADPWGNARVLMDALPSGSYLVISHLGIDFYPDTMREIVNVAAAEGLTLAPRSQDEVARFFDGWELLEPGVVPVMEYWDDRDPAERNLSATYWAGVARKP